MDDSKSEKLNLTAVQTLLVEAQEMVGQLHGLNVKIEGNNRAVSKEKAEINRKLNLLEHLCDLAAAGTKCEYFHFKGEWPRASVVVVRDGDDEDPS